MGFRRRRSLRLNFAQSKLLAHRPDGPANKLRQQTIGVIFKQAWLVEKAAN
jgi:hypothetical protein